MSRKVNPIEGTKEVQKDIREVEVLQTAHKLEPEMQDTLQVAKLGIPRPSGEDLKMKEYISKGAAVVVDVQAKTAQKGVQST